MEQAEYLRVEQVQENNNTLAVLGLILLVLVYLGRVQELFPVFTGISLGKIVFGIAVILYLLSPNKSRGKLSGIPQVRYVSLLFILGMVSIPQGAWPGNSFDVMVNDFLKLVLFFFLILKSINTRHDLRVLTWGIVIAVAILGLCTIALEKVGRLAVSSTYDPNDLAFVMVVFLPLVYYLARDEAGLKKITLYGALVVMVITVLYTVSRGGFVGLLSVSALMLLRSGRSIFSLILPGILLFVIFAAFAPATYWERMSTMLEPSKDYNMQEGVSGRKEVWRNGIILIKENPILGVGVGGFPIAEGMVHGGRGKWSAAHNSFIQIGAELGIIGLILFILLLHRSVQGLKKIRTVASKEILWAVNGTEIGLYGYMITGFFLSQAYSSSLYLLVAMSVILTGMGPAIKEERVVPHLPGSGRGERCSYQAS